MQKLNTIDLNVTQIILFNSPRDLGQIGILGRQLVIDLDIRSSRNLSYCSRCSADEPTQFYCATDQLFISINDEFTRLLYS